MKIRPIVALCCSILTASVGLAPAEIYLRLSGLTGSSIHTNYSGWIDLQSASVANLLRVHPNTAAGDFCLTKAVDSTSPRLTDLCIARTPISNATVDFIEAGTAAVRYLRLNLTNILLTGVSQSIQGNTPSESICLSPEIWSWNYTQYQTNTALPATYIFTSWNSTNRTATHGTNYPFSVITGIRKTNRVTLSWTATTGRAYRIFAAPALNQPFIPLGQLTASSTGPTNYNFVPTTPAMFYTVEEIPPGY
jgi:type VI protein secretion system component Hcp